MKKTETKVLVVWLEPHPNREKGAAFTCLSTVQNIKSAQRFIGRLTMQNYRFNWAYVFNEDDIDTMTTHLHNELTKGLK